MDYTTLIASKTTPGSLKSWINRDTIDPATILGEAQALIYTTLRHWKMKNDDTATMVIGSDELTLPPDFIDTTDFRITGIYAQRLRKGDDRAVHNRYIYDGNGVRINMQPCWFYLAACGAMFDYPADKAYPCLLSYFARPRPLGPLNLTNFLTNDAPRLLRTACMLSGVEFEKEVGQGQFDRSYWQQQFDKQLGEFQAMSDVAAMGYDAMAEFA